ncbi:unnamed protein product [Staurois parvus]|uniref:Uncharacterized protein n=1 Tax=Staurois parvus TaxID=386267 RepID=A0ABN9DKM8_9NEOB|nr:unnamed protein product [Staurois parvus]
MTRETCGHSTGDDQRLRTVQDDQMTADSTGDDQRLRTVQGMTRDCGQYRG